MTMSGNLLKILTVLTYVSKHPQNERYQKKMKKLKAILSKSRQDSSLKLFELKDENTKLSEENTKLQGISLFS